MLSTVLFAYGTLRPGNPAHRQLIRGATGWQPAALAGQLGRTSTGFPVARVRAAGVLLAAGVHPAADEARRRALPAWMPPRTPAPGECWIDGELLFLRDAELAWPALDAWEEFAPLRPGPYRRCVVPIRIQSRFGLPHCVPGWAYVGLRD